MLGRVPDTYNSINKCLIFVGHEMTLKRKRMKTKNFLPGVSPHPRSLSMNEDIVSGTGVTAKGCGYL